MNAESIDTLLKIVFLFLFIISCQLMIKYINGDFSVKTIDKINENELLTKDQNGNIVAKVIVTTYKYTYNDNRIRYKTKKISIKMINI